MNRGAVALIGWRTRARLSLSVAAATLGISVPHLCNLEAGRKLPSLALAVAIEQAAGISVRAWLQPAGLHKIRSRGRSICDSDSRLPLDSCP